jgi:gluconokinase
LVVVIMGVSGAGKTTIGQMLAAELGWGFADGDDYHSPDKVEKMRSGVPLTDADRAPWLEALRNAIKEWIAAAKNMVLACSALKQTYRDYLHVSAEVEFVYLKVSPPLLHKRLRVRVGHFMTEKMLDSQLVALEEPTEMEAMKTVITINADGLPEQVITEVRNALVGFLPVSKNQNQHQD